MRAIPSAVFRYCLRPPFRLPRLCPSASLPSVSSLPAVLSLRHNDTLRQRRDSDGQSRHLTVGAAYGAVSGAASFAVRRGGGVRRAPAAAPFRASRDDDLQEHSVFRARRVPVLQRMTAQPPPGGPPLLRGACGGQCVRVVDHQVSTLGEDGRGGGRGIQACRLVIALTVVDGVKWPSDDHVSVKRGTNEVIKGEQFCRYIHGKVPDLVLFDSANREVARYDVSVKTFDEIEKLVQSLGFKPGGKIAPPLEEDNDVAVE
ncbi:unnamed protein product [Closterium sp. NIES-64]|nr:unnamed protein product [Closterium sp. NIES-64]